MSTATRIGLEKQLLPLKRLLDEAHELLKIDEVPMGMKTLFQGLWHERHNCSPDEWRRRASFCLLHPIRELIHNDPITRRSYLKPRGYAGDAELLDLIYEAPMSRRTEEATCQVGSQIYGFTGNESAAVAVRTRREILSKMIDEIAQITTLPRILSVAAGHLREAELSLALQTGLVEELIAMDHDEKSLVETRSCYGRYGVTPLQLSVRMLLAGKHHLGRFDLIYSAGLYDYLNDTTARRLTAKLFAMLKPGGRLAVTNFRDNIPAAGYMESFMDWWLILRSDDEVEALDSEIDRAEVADKQLYCELNQNIAFMVLWRG